MTILVNDVHISLLGPLDSNLQQSGNEFIENIDVNVDSILEILNTGAMMNVL